MKTFVLFLLFCLYSGIVSSQCCQNEPSSNKINFNGGENFGQIIVCGEQLDLCGSLMQKYLPDIMIFNSTNASLQNPIAFEFESGDTDFEMNVSIAGVGQLFIFEYDEPCHKFNQAWAQEHLYIAFDSISNDTKLLPLHPNKYYLIIVDGYDGDLVNYTIQSEPGTLNSVKYGYDVELSGPDTLTAGGSGLFSISELKIKEVKFCGNTSECCGDSLATICFFNPDSLIYTWFGPHGSIITPTNASGSAISLEVGDEGGFLCCTITEAGNDCLNLTLCKNIYVSQYLNFAICEGETVYFNGESYTQEGTYTSNYFFTDYYINVSFYPSMDLDFDLEICSNDTISIGNENYVFDHDTTIVQTSQNEFGCSININNHVSVLQTTTVTYEYNFCAGDSITIEGITYTNDSTFTTDNGELNENGCKQYSAHKITKIPMITNDISVNIEQGDSYLYNGDILTDEGTYTYYFQAQTGCDSIVNIIISFVEPIVSHHELYICAGQSVDFNGSTFTQTGEYSIISYDFENHKKIDSIHVYAYDESKDTDFDILFAQGIKQDIFNLKVNNRSISDLIWSPSELFSCGNCNEVEANIKTSQYIYISGKNENGCDVKDSLWVNVIQTLDIVFVANIFSPNEDGINDRLVPELNEAYEFTEFSVFNRWGQEVFSGNEKNGWDGMTRGKPAESGVYVYLLKYRNISTGETNIAKGSVSLVR